MDVATPGQKARFFAKGLPQSWIDGQWQLQRGILKQVYCLHVLCCCCAAAVVCPALRPYAPLSPLLPVLPPVLYICGDYLRIPAVNSLSKFLLFIL